MKKTVLLLALVALTLPLIAQPSDSSFYEETTFAQRQARSRDIAQKAAEAQAGKAGDIYRGTILNAKPSEYTSSTLSTPAPAKTKYVYETSLIRAIKANDDDRVRTLIYANVDVNERNYANLTPLTVAAEKGNLLIVRYLVEAEADVNAASPYGVTPLVAASATGHADVVEYLLAHGANANVMDETHKTPLLYAAHFSDASLIDALAKQSPAAINLSDAAGNTPLIYAAQKGYESGVKALVSNGADVNYRNPSTGISAIAAAAAEGHVNVLKMLAKNHADVNITDEEGRTPLALTDAPSNGQPQEADNACRNQSDGAGLSPYLRYCPNRLHNTQ